jgi:hypothetical protein
MKHVIWVLWPAFVAGGIAEVVFFTLIDPQQLYLLGRPVDLSPLATYSIGFLLFWAICAGSSLMTWFMLPKDVKDALAQAANSRPDLARPYRSH